MDATENAAKDLAEIAAQLADPARAAMILRLMDGESQPTGELILSANVSASSASGHLSKLVDARILAVGRQGRHKHYRIATAAVAHAVEALSIVASPRKAFRAALRSSVNPFAFARTCYDHLAGSLGVEISSSLQRLGFLRVSGKEYELTETGSRWLEGLGIDSQRLREERRSFAPQCLDWTERRYHVAGALGAALLKRIIELGWLAKSRVPRSVRLTTRGKEQLQKELRLVITEREKVVSA